MFPFLYLQLRLSSRLDRVLLLFRAGLEFPVFLASLELLVAPVDHISKQLYISLKNYNFSEFFHSLNNLPNRLKTDCEIRQFHLPKMEPQIIIDLENINCFYSTYLSSADFLIFLSSEGDAIVKQME